MHIRQAEERDLQPLLDLFDKQYAILIQQYGYPFSYSREENEQALATQIKSKFYAVLVAEEGGALKGFVNGTLKKLDRHLSFQGQKMIGHICELYVEEDVRGAGVAKLLMDAMEDWLREREVSFVETYVQTENRRSLRFHEKRAFQPAAYWLCRPL